MQVSGRSRRVRAYATSATLRSRAAHADVRAAYVTLGVSAPRTGCATERAHPTNASVRTRQHPHVTKYTEYDDTTLNQFSFNSFLYRILYNGAESVKKTIERKLG